MQYFIMVSLMPSIGNTPSLFLIGIPYCIYSGITLITVATHFHALNKRNQTVVTAKGKKGKKMAGNTATCLALSIMPCFFLLLNIVRLQQCGMIFSLPGICFSLNLPG